MSQQIGGVVNLRAQTTVPDVVSQPDAVSIAVQALLDKSAITDLVALYAMARDDHDLEQLIDCFAPDGAFIHGGQPIRGHDALREYYRGNMRRNVFSLHVPNSHVVSLTSPTTAVGLATGHAEFASEHGVLHCAFRYSDEYVRLDRRWVFSSRSHDFAYAVPVERVGDLGRDELRIRFPGSEPRTADWVPRPI